MLNFRASSSKKKLDMYKIHEAIQIIYSDLLKCIIFWSNDTIYPLKSDFTGSLLYIHSKLGCYPNGIYCLIVFWSRYWFLLENIFQLSSDKNDFVHSAEFNNYLKLVDHTKLKFDFMSNSVDTYYNLSFPTWINELTSDQFHNEYLLNKWMVNAF